MGQLVREGFERRLQRKDAAHPFRRKTLFHWIPPHQQTLQKLTNAEKTKGTEELWKHRCRTTKENPFIFPRRGGGLCFLVEGCPNPKRFVWAPPPPGIIVAAGTYTLTPLASSEPRQRSSSSSTLRAEKTESHCQRAGAGEHHREGAAAPRHSPCAPRGRRGRGSGTAHASGSDRDSAPPKEEGPAQSLQVGGQAPCAVTAHLRGSFPCHSGGPRVPHPGWLGVGHRALPGAALRRGSPRTAPAAFPCLPRVRAVPERARAESLRGSSRRRRTWWERGGAAQSRANRGGHPSPPAPPEVRPGTTSASLLFSSHTKVLPLQKIVRDLAAAHPVEVRGGEKQAPALRADKTPAP